MKCWKWPPSACRHVWMRQVVLRNARCAISRQTRDASPRSVWHLRQHGASHSNMSARRRRPLLALHLIASFIPWTKVSPSFITCPSVGYFARHSEKTGAYGEWDTLYKQHSANFYSFIRPHIVVTRETMQHKFWFLRHKWALIQH